MRKINSLIALLLLVAVTTQWSCSAELFNDCLNGEGDRETRILELEPIDRIEIFGSIELKIKEGAEQNIEVRSQTNLVERLIQDSFVENGRWRVGINGCVDADNIEITITIPLLKGIAIDGSGEVKTEGVFENIDDLDLSVIGSGDLKLDFGTNINALNTEITGSAEIDLTGEAVTHSISISGSGEIESFGFKTQNTDITISGSGDCEVFVENELDVIVSGSGDICFKGNPSISQNISGDGEVKDCN